jgi:large subunit ribosomal protein L23
MKGKRVRYGRVSGKKKNWKKAIVTLKQGDKIAIYEGV